MMQKTFVGALESFFADERLQLGGQRTRKVFVQAVLGMVSFIRKPAILLQGIQWGIVWSSC